MKGNSQEVPLPVCRAATVVGPANEGIQKNPSVRSPLKLEGMVLTQYRSTTWKIIHRKVKMKLACYLICHIRKCYIKTNPYRNGS